jgi:acetyl esterase
MTRRGVSLLLWTGGGLALLAAVAYAALQLSPWPAALVIRWAFDLGGRRTAQAMREHVPTGVAAQLNRQYGASEDADTLLDVFYPAALPPEAARLTVVWVHGGGWVSGSKEQVDNYARILASHGYTVAAINYSVAPAHTYPLPVRQANLALSYLAAHAAGLHVDPGRFVLAGDSAGAQIAAQVANTITSSDYAQLLGVSPGIAAEQLKGVMLYCGPYDTQQAPARGLSGLFPRAVLWAYSGRRAFLEDPFFATAAVGRYLTERFPPSFISAGNVDPLAAQSYAFAAELVRRGVAVETLFFPAAARPATAHEYQFDLDGAAGRLALSRSLAFLAGR